MGCVPGIKLEFCLNFLTAALAEKPTTAVAVVIFPNRANHLDMSLVRSTPSKKSSSATACKDEEEDEDEDTSDGDASMDPEAELRTIMHDIVSKFSSPSRGLRTRSIMITYDHTTLYGRREGVCPAFLVTASNEDNVFWESTVWRTRLVSSVKMLQRDEMIKPMKRSRAGIPQGANFTDAQERKQHHTGLSLVTTVLDNLLPDPTRDGVLIVDLHGYDGFPSLAALDRAQKGNKAFACTVCHEPETALCVADRIGQAVYTAAKEGKLVVPGFPDFAPVVKELQDQVRTPTTNTATYHVCNPMVDGTLRILDMHLDLWLPHAVFGEPMVELVEAHNKEFNPTGARGGGTEVDEEPDNKRARLTLTLPECDAPSYSELVKKHPKMCPCIWDTCHSFLYPCVSFHRHPFIPRRSVQEGNYDLHVVPAGDALYIQVKQECTISASKVLFSFGSGDWVDGLDATHAMDEGNRWLSYQVTSLQQRVVLDKKNFLPPFDNLDIVKTGGVITLQTALDAFVTCGEVAFTMTHHNLGKDNGTWTITPKTNLVFLLDPKKALGDGKKKKAKKAKKGKNKANAKVAAKNEEGSANEEEAR